ncbi:hypothetical protein GCM10010172_48280 [Paractinoplanes ferrugineus]|uniref:Uncharacterized protein n=1 Tax=Paractinoplanes ferrugineus TaxID=113564 RepID=A0A919MDZ2_9ACTN|nr:hypothetical protein [Actinoplanes ferrugineus]GIE11089.1 hypothetical protein Afe05nite_29290 [Actinoplanes ferrugineus]
MKLKLTKRQITIIAVAAIAVLALLVSRGRKVDSGPEGIDAHARQACSDFAAGYPKAKAKAARLTLADRVTANSSKSDNDLIRKRAATMGASANDSDTEWRAAADALTSACRTG